jgi:CPA1 family monovalent cation:H+ antiporter
MHELELVLALLVVVTALTPIARRLRVPYPILLVLAGLILALLPAVPDIPLDPNLALLLFLPPLLYSASFSTSVRDFRGLLRPILSLAVGLVLVTTAVVAVVLNTLLPGIGWAAAFAFGAIVSPPDAVAAVAVFRGLGVPRRLVTLLEGESLVNDATALVTYRTAVAAMAVAFSAGEASVRFVVVGVGGVLVGLVVAVLVAALRRRIEDPSVEIALTLLTPFAAYLPAEQLGLSGVLATVAAGLYLGWREPYITGSESRLGGRAVWQMVDFVLNGLVFILIGLQLSLILPALAGHLLIPLIGTGLLVSLAMIVVRLAWIFGDSYLRWWLDRRKARAHGRPDTAPAPRRRENLVAGWAGMRGVVSLAAALALPATTPERASLIFLTFLVILVTLVGQGLTLPLLIRALGVAQDGNGPAQQELRARRTVTEAALARINQLAGQWPTHLPLINALRAQYEHRASHLEDLPAEPEEENPADQELLEHHMIRRAVIDAERSAALHLRERGDIDDTIWRDIERELDLEELRMDA